MLTCTWKFLIYWLTYIAWLGSLKIVVWYYNNVWCPSEQGNWASLLSCSLYICHWKLYSDFQLGVFLYFLTFLSNCRKKFCCNLQETAIFSKLVFDVLDSFT